MCVHRSPLSLWQQFLVTMSERNNSIQPFVENFCARSKLPRKKIGTYFWKQHTKNVRTLLNEGHYVVLIPLHKLNKNLKEDRRVMAWATDEFERVPHVLYRNEQWWILRSDLLRTSCALESLLAHLCPLLEWRTMVNVEIRASGNCFRFSERIWFAKERKEKVEELLDNDNIRVRPVYPTNQLDQAHFIMRPFGYTLCGTGTYLHTATRVFRANHLEFVPDLVVIRGDALCAGRVLEVNVLGGKPQKDASTKSNGINRRCASK